MIVLWSSYILYSVKTNKPPLKEAHVWKFFKSVSILEVVA